MNIEEKDFRRYGIGKELAAEGNYTVQSAIFFFLLILFYYY